MGLDIYAGTLTRYYSHNWKTVVQQWAEENGYTFNRITPDGEPADNEEELSPAEVQAAVENWRDQILSAISQPDQLPYTPWNGRTTQKPICTHKPDWHAFGAMLLVGAACQYVRGTCASHRGEGLGLRGASPDCPPCIGRGAGVVPASGRRTRWLPLTDSFFYFQGPLPTDDTAPLSPPWADCRKELEKLKTQLAWQADEDTILGWADAEGCPVDGTV